MVYVWFIFIHRVTLPNSELLLPADGQKTARDICIPALTKEGLEPSSVVLYLVSEVCLYV